VKNYSSEEIFVLFESIRRALPTGNEQWELVADLHSVHFANCNRSGDSIKKKFYKLANAQPKTGNPSISQETRMAKEIKEAINVKAGVTDADVTDADVSEFFDQSDQLEDELDDGEVEEAHAGTTGETAVPETINTSVSGRRSSNVSGISATNQSITAAASLNNKKTRGNIITSAIQQATEQTKSSFEQFILSKQMAEEFEWKQRRIEREMLEQQRREEREEDRKRRAEELHEMRLKESRQQEQLNNLLQIAVTGMMAYMTAKHQNANDDSKPPGKN
jgi:hypothetical protein